MKRLLVSMVALCFVASLAAFAEGDKAAPAPEKAKPAVEKAVKAEKAAVEKAVKTEKAAVELKDITVVGKIEVKKEGEKTAYVLKTADGKIALPEVKAEVADLEKMVGKDVKIVGKGTEAGKKVTLKSITSVAIEAAAPAKAPAATPAAPAEVK